MRLCIALVGFAFAFVQCTPARSEQRGLQRDLCAGRATGVERPPSDVVRRYSLSPKYERYVCAAGLPVLGSKLVSPYALLEARYVIEHQLAGASDALRETLAKSKVRVVVMAPTELTTDVPEHSDLTPASYWNRRARGLGATDTRPAVSTGEENLLGYRGDPYAAENILVHEFGHVVHQHGAAIADPTFQARLEAAYARAMAAGLWKGTYAAENVNEYWAEGVQSFFDTNRKNDNQHNDVDTRDKLAKYDPALAALLVEVFGRNTWRYQRPDARAASERVHLAGFDPSKAPVFAWPADLRDAPTDKTKTIELALRKTTGATFAPSPRTSAPTTVVFENRGSVAASIYWSDFTGALKHYASVDPGKSYVQSTYVGHRWIVKRGDESTALDATPEALRVVF